MGIQNMNLYWNGLIEGFLMHPKEFSDKFFIKSVDEIDDETGNPLFWSNNLGWTSILNADSYTPREKELTHLPLYGEWYHYKPIPHEELPEGYCQICELPQESKEGVSCVCVCPRCGCHVFDDVTLGDHGMCYDCFQLQRNGRLCAFCGSEIAVDEQKHVSADGLVWCDDCNEDERYLNI